MEQLIYGILNTIYVMYAAFFSAGVIEVLVLPAWFIIEKHNKEIAVILKRYIVLTMVMLIVFGTFFSIVTRDFEGYFVGFLNLIPCEMIIALSFTYTIINCKSENKTRLMRKRVLLVALFLVIVFILGKSNYIGKSGENQFESNISFFDLSNDEAWGIKGANNEVVNNYAKVPNEVVQIVDAICTDYSQPVIFAPFEMSIYIRQYNPECKLLSGRYAEVWNEKTIKEYNEADPFLLRNVFNDNKDSDVTHIVIPINDVDKRINDINYARAMKEGWQLYAIVGHYMVFVR